MYKRTNQQTRQYHHIRMMKQSFLFFLWLCFCVVAFFSFLITIVQAAAIKKVEPRLAPSQLFHTKEAVRTSSLKKVIPSQLDVKLNINASRARDLIQKARPQRLEQLNLYRGKENYFYQGVGSILLKKTPSLEIRQEMISQVNADNGEVSEVAAIPVITRAGKVIKEKENQLIFLNRKNMVVTLDNVDTSVREVIKQKLISESAQAFASQDIVETVAKNATFRAPKKIVKVLLQLNKECAADITSKYFVLSQFESENYVFAAIKVRLSDIKSLVNSDCVKRVVEKTHIPLFLKEAKQVFTKERDEKIKKLRLKRTFLDIIDKDKLRTYLQSEGWTPKEGQSSEEQSYVTPEAGSVSSLVSSSMSREEIYKIAESWYWVSDDTLFSQPEKWLTPESFLTITPTMASNPLPGEIVSDCSEQANTLVSMYRAAGVSADDVRVAIGKVNFDGQIGGHAWVEIKEDGQWMVLDPTAGSYYDDVEGKVVERDGVSYDYWKYHPYPIVEVWAYYNDIYYSGKGVEIASGWADTASTQLETKLDAAFDQQIIEEAKDNAINVWWTVVEWVKGLIHNLRVL